jgi:hypothetical protein
MALRTVKGAADQKGKPAFLFFEKPVKGAAPEGSVNVDLNKVMQNMGGEAFTYESFKNAYDSDPRIKKMVKNFSEAGINLKTKEDSTPGGDSSTSADSVGKMAAAATDVGAKL